MSNIVSVDADRLAIVVDAAREGAAVYLRHVNDARARGLTKLASAVGAWRQDILDCCEELASAVKQAGPGA